MSLTSPVNALLGDAQATGRITNDDASTVTPALSIDDVSISEGDAAAVAASFTVRLSAPTGVPVSVQFATANGTAVAGSDYTAASGTVTLPPGTTSAPVLVTVLGDLADEGDETFTVNLTAPANATIGDAQGLGTIVNNDSPAAGPSMSIAPVAVPEGNRGTSTASFVVDAVGGLDADGQRVVRHECGDGGRAGGLSRADRRRHVPAEHDRADHRGGDRRRPRRGAGRDLPRDAQQPGERAPRRRPGARHHPERRCPADDDDRRVCRGSRRRRRS